MCKIVQTSGAPQSRSFNLPYLEFNYRITTLLVWKGEGKKKKKKSSVFPKLNVEFHVTVVKPDYWKSPPQTSSIKYHKLGLVILWQLEPRDIISQLLEPLQYSWAHAVHGELLGVIPCTQFQRKMFISPKLSTIALFGFYSI